MGGDRYSDEDNIIVEPNLTPIPIRLEKHHRVKAAARMKERKIKSLAGYIRNLIDNDN